MPYLTSLLRSKYDIGRKRGVVCDIDVNIYIIYKRQVFEPFPRGSFDFKNTFCIENTFCLDIDVNIYIIYKCQVFEPFPRGSFNFFINVFSM
jgi:hypothetical protein